MNLTSSLLGVYEGADYDDAKIDADHHFVIYLNDNGAPYFAYYYQFEVDSGFDELLLEGTWEIANQKQMILHIQSHTQWGIHHKQQYAKQVQAQNIHLSIHQEADKFTFDYNGATFHWHNEDTDFVLGWIHPIRSQAQKLAASIPQKTVRK